VLRKPVFPVVSSERIIKTADGYIGVSAGLEGVNSRRDRVGGSSAGAVHSAVAVLLKDKYYIRTQRRWKNNNNNIIIAARRRLQVSA